MSWLIIDTALGLGLICLYLIWEQWGRKWTRRRRSRKWGRLCR